MFVLHVNACTRPSVWPPSIKLCPSESILASLERAQCTIRNIAVFYARGTMVHVTWMRSEPANSRRVRCVQVCANRHHVRSHSCYALTFNLVARWISCFQNAHLESKSALEISHSISLFRRSIGRTHKSFGAFMGICESRTATTHTIHSTREHRWITFSQWPSILCLISFEIDGCTQEANLNERVSKTQHRLYWVRGSVRACSLCSAGNDMCWRVCMYTAYERTFSTIDLLLLLSLWLLLLLYSNWKFNNNSIHARRCAGQCLRTSMATFRNQHFNKYINDYI